MTTKLYLPKYCILEAPIRECEHIPEAAKIYFGELAVLASKYDYIPYTDEQLAEMKNVPVRTVQNWHTDLEKYGFIQRESKNTLVESENGHKWVRKRKMFIYQNPNSKNVCGSAKNCGTDDTAKNCGTDDTAKNCGSYKQEEKQESLNNNTSLSSKTYECLDKLNLTAKEKEKITQKIEEDKAIELVKRVLAWKTRGKDIIAVNTILREWDTWENPPEYEPKKNESNIHKSNKPLSYKKLSKEDEEFIKRGYYV